MDRHSTIIRSVITTGCRGTSLIEILTSLGIIALLISLIAPAVQQSREQARRLDCLNRMRQVALGVHAFHDQHGHLPGPLRTRTVPPFPAVLSVWAWILPQLDQSSMFQMIDNDPSETGIFLVIEGPPVFVRPGNQLLSRTPLTVVVCPSDSAPIGGCNLRASMGTFPVHDSRRARADYGFPGIFNGSGSSKGRPRFAQVTDGLSQTAMLSERVSGDQNPDSYSPMRDTYHVRRNSLWEFAGASADEISAACRERFTQPLPGEMSFGGASWLLCGYTHTSYNHLMTPNSRTPDCTTEDSMNQVAATARSFHHGGVNVALGDGGVRFVSNSIDLRVWRALGSKNGNESFSLGE